MICRRADIASTLCLHCARGNRRFTDCVRIRPRRSGAFPDDFFNGACANYLPSAATTCSLGKLTPSFVASASQGRFKAAATRSVEILLVPSPSHPLKRLPPVNQQSSTPRICRSYASIGLPERFQGSPENIKYLILQLNDGSVVLVENHYL